MKIALNIIAFILLVSCNCSKDTAVATPKPDQSSQLTGIDGIFYVKQVYDLKVNDPNAKVTFSRNKNSFSGHTGCNQFTGQIFISNPSISISKLIVTEAFCQDKKQQEKLFLKALNNASTYTYNSDGLRLKNAQGNTTLIASSRAIQ